MNMILLYNDNKLLGVAVIC